VPHGPGTRKLWSGSAQYQCQHEHELEPEFEHERERRARASTAKENVSPGFGTIVSHLAMRGVCTLAIVVMIAGCGSPAARVVVPGLAPQSLRAPGNIYWNKRRLNLPYPAMSHGQAILTYWGPDGYYTEPHFCKGNGRFSATAHRHYGNQSKYVHVVYWFKALSPGPDDCAFTAVLNNTGSPPIAIVKMRIGGR
jgi:hypothetical protein